MNNILKEIESNINNYGHHITIVTEGLYPRFAYTIGALDKVNFEIIFAGGIFYSNKEVSKIINIIIEKLEEKKNWVSFKLEIDILGVFTLSEVDSSWSKLLMLGAYDFYNKNEIPTLQIIPDINHYTFDIPKLKNNFNPSKEPVWKYLVDEWDYSVAKNVTVVTNLDALFGQPITEVMRWEEDEWEMFSGAGPDVEKEEIRIVPIGLLLGLDNSISQALKLDIGKGMWRDKSDMKWNKWG
ncbi:DUF4262 domain-containing protein [Urechidicola croceus]|uniref:DUF4262 domain-containing protein n=1 Tax=Urechidicola croceus TaxID=1850246 RepID=A0A1D8P870_9FLAO|nr:DUF4262 domain-containing protein [Urechidicola croceus]AOW20770.1 hypothetical protein LPB138_08810 [Urechidicola croceus]